MFSESSSQALSVFNKANLLDLVAQCLERHSQNVELAISAGGMFLHFVFFLMHMHVMVKQLKSVL